MSVDTLKIYTVLISICLCATQISTALLLNWIRVYAKANIRDDYICVMLDKVCNIHLWVVAITSALILITPRILS